MFLELGTSTDDLATQAKRCVVVNVSANLEREREKATPYPEHKHTHAHASPEWLIGKRNIFINISLELSLI